MEPTLEASLARLFGGQVPAPAAGADTASAAPAAPSGAAPAAGGRR